MKIVLILFYIQELNIILLEYLDIYNRFGIIFNVNPVSHFKALDQCFSNVAH